MDVRMADGIGPVFPHPLKSPSDPQFAAVLSVAPTAAADELTYVYQAVTLTREKLQGRVPVIGFCGSPWTLLCYMVEGGGTKMKMFKEAKTWIYAYPDASKRLLQRIAEICVEYLARQVSAGAQLVQVFDSWAGELSPSAFAEFSLPYLRWISQNLPGRVEELKGRGERVPMTVFAKGANYALEELCASGYDVVGLDWQIDPAAAVQVARGRVALQGNMDPGVLYGGREAITREVERMVRAFGNGRDGRWVVNLGHGVTPSVKPDDLRWFFDEVVRCTTPGIVSWQYAQN